MKIVTLLENRKISEELVCNHGLSLYIETEQHKILFDMGSNDNFIKNAEKLGVDLSKVDTAIVSHGHYDHGGGLEAFLAINKSAKVYLSKTVFDKAYVEILKVFNRYIGIDQKLKDKGQLVYVDNKYQIDDKLLIFGRIEGNIIIPPGNKRLLKKSDSGNLSPDDFGHEINLIIKENDKNYLISGCSHRGIVNIIDRAKEFTSSDVDVVIGGMHMMGLNPSKTDHRLLLDDLCSRLNDSGVSKFYTGHCTSEIVYDYMLGKMDNISDIKTGSVLEF